MSTEVLRIENLHVSVEGTPILNGLSLVVHEGETHAIMGRNGAGKSTLASVLMGHPDYVITEGKVYYFGQPLEELDVVERAKAGMFLSFQYPVVIPGVPVGTFLKKSVNAVRQEELSAREFRMLVKDKMSQLEMDSKVLSRSVNDGFSGGEKKRLEILQMLMLQPRLALLDETDSGLDIDALRIVAEGINSLPKTTASIVITHYQRLLTHVKPSTVHVMINGVIVKTGGPELALKLEEQGYDWLDEDGEAHE